MFSFYYFYYFLFIYLLIRPCKLAGVVQQNTSESWLFQLYNRNQTSLHVSEKKFDEVNLE